MAACIFVVVSCNQKMTDTAIKVNQPAINLSGKTLAGATVISFGPDNVLLVGDSKAGVVHAIPTKATVVKDPVHINAHGIDRKIANKLGVAPSDLIINLDPGACDAVVSYSVSATDNCPLVGPAVALTTNNDFSVGNITNSLACPGGGYQTLLAYDLPAMGVTTDLLVTSVDFAVFQVLGNPTLTMNVYSIAAAPGGAFTYADLTLIGSGTQVAGPSGAAILNMPVLDTNGDPLNVPAGTVLVIDLQLFVALRN